MIALTHAQYLPAWHRVVQVARSLRFVWHGLRIAFAIVNTALATHGHATEGHG